MLKILKYFFFLKNVIFKFKKLHKREIIIFDSSNVDSLKEIIPKDKYFVLPVRPSEIKEIYLSFKLIIFLIENIFKRSPKQNYLNFIIQQVDPKTVVTAVETSADFYFSADYFKETKIKFVAIQHSCLRGAGFVNDENLNKIIYIPNFLCFSEYEKKLFKNTKAKIKRYLPVGSLRASLFIRRLKNKNLNIIKKVYDICLIGEPSSRTTNDLKNISDYYEIPGKVAEYTLRVCKKNNLKLIFSGKNRTFNNSHLEEKQYYKYFLKDYDYTIVPKENSFSTFENAFKSELIIGHNSTFLREISALHKKVLSLNFLGHDEFKEPFSGITYLEKFSFEEFEKRVLELIQLNQDEYRKKFVNSPEFISITAADTIENIKKEIL